MAALAGVDLDLFRGQRVALVGESGAGKSTLARCLARLENPDAGEIRFDGKDILKLPRTQLASLRRRVQLVFQHSGTALNPFHSAEEIVGEPLRVQGQLTKGQRRKIVLNYMEQVGLSAQWASRRPWQFSGGQRQRLAVARAMILDPDLVIFDEAFSGLDAATRRDIVDLLLRLQASGRKSYLFITHDLQMTADLAESIFVMKNGKITESKFLSNGSLPGLSLPGLTAGPAASTSHA
jgi:ABC-type glutathione transport system ATPase component